ncbi:Ig-like domain-containing protein [Gimesia sp.]|uniref:Ig-like domain-containing protein n=1 Tax=Gimesia sp. TaxID=2024833 RepID=UPI003A9282E5
MLNCLRRGQRKRQSRNKIKNYVSSYSTAEQLEDRTLLAGASLVNIEPNIDLSLTDGEVYNEAPQELTFVFSPGQEIDPDSLGGIQIVRSGSDGTFADGNEVLIQPGYVGIGDNPNEVIVRFASALPDDHYQITILGTGADPLLNLNGDAFQDFTDDGIQNGADETINFELDLGAKVVAVVSQPVLREQVLSVGNVANLQDGDTFTITVGGAVVTFEMDLDGGGLNDANNLQVSYTAADSATDIATTILGEFNSSILGTEGYATISQSGADLTISGDSFTPAISFSLVDPGNPAFSRADGNLVARDNQILVYFNDDDLNPDLANDERFYQIIPTSTDKPLPSTDYTATYDALSDVTVLEFSTPLIAGQQYRLRVGVSDTPNKITKTYSTIGKNNQTISILAGNGGTVTPIDGITSITDLALNDFSSLVVDGTGNYYFVHDDGTNVRILRVDHETGIITFISGSDGSLGPANGIQASDLQLTISGPRDLTLDATGNLYFTDGAFVLKIDAVSQLVTVIAGGGFDDTPDPGDVPTDLLLDTPAQLVIDSDGNIYFHDSGAGQLIFIDGNSGLVLTAASTQFGTSPFTFSLDITDLEVDPVGNLFILTPGFPPIFSFPGLDEGIYYIDLQSGQSVFYGGSSPDLNFDPANPTALLIPVAGGGSTPLANGVSATDLDLSSATDFTFDANGYLVYSDSAGHIVRLNPYADPVVRLVEIIAGGGGTSVSASGVVASDAQLGIVTSVAIGSGNTPFFFDSTNNQLLNVENIPDKNSSFNTATKINGLSPDITFPWNPDSEEFVITSEIQPQGIGLPPLPGGNDEPGHRQLPATLDAHIGSVGTNPVTAGSVSVVYYNFRDAYGTDVQGNQLHNAITEEQKQRTREIFEIYAYYLGIEFVESANQGITVVTGDLRVADPGLPVGPGGVGGVSTGPMVIMDFSDYTNPSDDVYGGSWMGTAFHEIGHSLGLGHALDIPSVMGDPLPQAGGQTVFPGDYDLTHLLRLYRTDANDIDLYEFNLVESGTFRAEIFAERLQNSSLLNSTLTLFDEDHNVIARNDDYFSNDSFLELNLAAGTYFIGVTSTGNDNYNAEIENSGDNGSTDGIYELRLNFAPDPVSAESVKDNWFITDEAQVITGDLFVGQGAGIDTDPDTGGTFTITEVNGVSASVDSQITLASGALLTVNADGTFSYDPNGSFEYLSAGQDETDSFTYTITDDQGATDTAVVTITINGVNDNLLANDDAFDVNITGTFTGNVLLNNGYGADSDTDLNDTLMVSEVLGIAGNVSSQITLSSGALLTVNSDGTFLYDPNGQFDSLIGTATDSFTYKISDGNGSFDSALVTLTLSDGLVPIANLDTVTTTEDIALTNIDVLLNDTDPDGVSSNLAVTGLLSSTSALGAAISLSGNLINYDPTTVLNHLPSGQTVNDTFTYILQDEDGRKSYGTVQVTVTGVNDPPTAQNDTLTTGEDSLLSDNLFDYNGIDVDSDPDIGDSFTITHVDGSTGNVGSQISLASGALLTVDANGTFSYDPNGAFADLEQGENTTDSFTYTITDSQGGTDSATVSITINGNNDAPVAEDDAFSTDEVTTLTGGNVFNANPTSADSDVEGQSFSVTAVASGTVGSQFALASGAFLTLNSDGTFSYDPNSAYEYLALGETGTDSFTYTITDSQGGTDTATVTITINGINDGPVAQDDAIAINEDNPTFGNLIANNSNGIDSDPDTSDSFTITHVDGSTGNVGSQITLASGALLTVGADGTFSYDPNGNFEDLAQGETATDSFIYTITDSEGSTDTATVVITINGVNDAPVAEDDAFSTNEDTTLTGGNVLNANPTSADSDVEGQSFSVTAVANGTVGSQFALASGALLTLNSDGTFSYDPNSAYEYLALGETGTDSFTYTITDSQGGTDTATVTITIYGVNDAPVAQDDIVTMNEDSVLYGGNVFNINPATVDSDVEGQTFSVSAVTGGTVGSQFALASGALLKINADGTFSYDPNGNFESLALGETDTDSFTYTITDSQGGSDSATVIIIINGVNDAPVAQDDTVSVNEKFILGSNVLFANPTTADSDPEGQTITVTAVSGGTVDNSFFPLASGALLAMNANGTFSYDPNGVFAYLAQGETATDSFSYTITDAQGGTDTATVTVTIIGANDAPVAEDDAVTTDEDTTLTSDNLFADNGSGADSDPNTSDSFTVTGVTGGTVGSQFALASGALLTVNADGTFSYDPNGNFESLAQGETDTDYFTYTITDTQGGTDTARVTITINGVNDAPVAQDDAVSTTEATPLFGGNVLNGNPTTVDSDVEIQTITVTAVSGGTVGSQFALASGALLTINADGTFSYDPNGQFEFLALGETDTDSFIYTITDAQGGTDTATVTITINGLNDAPTANNDAIAVDRDNAIAGNVLNNNGSGADSDPDTSDSLILTVTAVDGGTVGSQFALGSGALLTLNADGTFSYDPTPSAAFQALTGTETATEIFTYTISDTQGATDTATVIFTISLNQLPIANSDAGLSTSEDSPTSGDLFADNLNDADVDPDTGDSITVLEVNDNSASVGTQITLASGALLTVNADGTFSYDPNGAFEFLAPGDSTTDSFTYTITDTHDATDTATVIITINGVNDAPVAQDDAFITDEDTILTTGNVLDANPTTSDFDVEGQTITVIGINGGPLSSPITLASGALLELNLDGTFSYNPNGVFNDLALDETATDSFTYRIFDGVDGTDTATVTITINGVNDAPVAEDDAVVTDEDTTLTGGNLFADNGSGADSDPDTSDSFTVTAVIGGTVGSQFALASGALLTVNADGTYSYDPNGIFESLAQGQTDTDSFTYTITDTQGGTDTATVTITINGVNDAPVAQDDAVTTDEDTTLTGGDLFADNGSGADSDPDTSDSFTVTAVIGGTVGSPFALASGALLTVNTDGTFSYDPNGAFETLTLGDVASDSFTYTITDSQGATDTATVTVTINGVNDAPVAEDDVFITTEDIALIGRNVLDANPTTPDSDVEGQTLSVIGLTGGPLSTPVILDSGALLILNADGTFIYDPNGSFEDLAPGDTATDSFTYRISDGSNGTDTATATITILGANDAPVAQDDAVSTDEDATLTGGDLFADNGNSADSDPDNGDSFIVTAVAGGTVGSQFALPSGALLTVNTNGTFSYNPNGSFESLALGETTTDSFVYTITDTNGATDTATVTITINGQNDAPTAQNDFVATTEDTAFSGNLFANNASGIDSDPDTSDSLIVTLVDGSSVNVGSQITLASGALLTVNANGTFTYDPNGAFENLAQGQTDTESFTYKITDNHGAIDTATATIFIIGVNDAPVAFDDAFTTNEDTPLTGGNVLDSNPSLSDSDAEGQALTVTSVAGGTVGSPFSIGWGGLLTVNADGTFTYDPNGLFDVLPAGQSYTESFNYTVSDSQGATDTATVTITITGVNDAPVAKNDPADIEILSDETDTQFDGDSDGIPGGAYDFWFVASDSTNTIYVDKTNTAVGDGTLGNAYSTISEALNNVTATTDVIRILGNGGTDGDLRTTNDSDNYLIGYDDDFNPLEDGESIIVPQGVTVVIDQGAVIKLQNTVIDVGSSSTLENRENAALQILGTPDAQVVLTAYGNDAVGGDDDGPSDGANPGDWGGIIFRADSDYEDDSVFLNYIANTDISYGGGQVFVDSVLQSIAPIHIDEARPTLAYNTITNSANAAISADPNSFDTAVMKGGDFNHDQTLKRIGPDIYGNTIVDNSLNGLFIRTETQFGQDIDQVNVTARFDDTDIVHIITENLFIEAGTGGPVATASGLQARYSGSVIFDAGMIVKLGGSRIQTGRGNAGIIAEGTEESPVIFTSLFDDRYGAGGTFDTTNNDSQGVNERGALAGDWGGIILNQTSHGSIDHAIIAFGGGTVPVDGFSDSFNAIEVHQADLRVANTLFESNAGVASSTDRNSLGRNEATTIFVRGAQPIIVNNRFVNNGGSVIDINANSLKSEILDDYGRSTGIIDSFDYLDGNAGPLVRLNRFENNGTNGMVIRGELLTVESVWDDTDIDHVLYDTITVDNFHTYGGLRLQSSTDASLVVKLGSGAGFTATGHGLDINDRIGGIVQILGDPQNPVVLTSVFDDTIGSGIGLDGYSVTETLTGVSTAPAAGDWTGLQFLEMSHDRNVAIYNENELAVLDGNGDVNGIIRKAQFLGELAPDEKSGDENRRLGFEVHGSIASNNSGDADIYSFNAEAGTEVWIDIDRTGLALDTVIELLDPLGRVIAVANNNTDAAAGTAPFATTPNPLIENSNFGGDFYSSNPNDAGMRIVLPGMDGILTTYFVRVRSNSGNLSNINGGESKGEYQLQVRLRQVDEEPGSTVRYSDIRYATDAIYLAGLPAHSPLINETVESGDASGGLATQNLGNLLTSDRNTIGVSGTLSSEGDVDFYQFDITIEDIQSIAGVNAGGKTWATVFDIDYADGLGRADTTLSVFDSSGRLIFVSRESNVEDDQPGVGQGADADDITRGSFGTQDPYIGSVHLPEAGTYYVAVSSNTRLATALEATYNGSNSNALVRLEPINSLQRIVEDHIGSQGYSSNGVDIEPDTPLFDITDGGISTHVTGFDLSDVVLFTTNGTNLSTVDPQLGDYETDVGDISGTNSTAYTHIRDIVMRSDGRLFGIRNNQLVEISTAGVAGSNPTTTATAVGTTNITTISGNQTVAAAYTENLNNLRTHLNLLNDRGTGNTITSIEAMTFARTGFDTNTNEPIYRLYYAVTETGRNNLGQEVTFQKLYEANPDTGAIIGDFEVNNNNTIQNGFRGYLVDDTTATTASASQSGTDTNSTPRSGTLYIQSVVPGESGDGIQVVITNHGATDDITVTSAGVIRIRLDNRSTGANSWNLGEIVAAINNDTVASQYVKAGMLGDSATNGYQAFNGDTLTTGGAIGTPSFNGLVTGMAFDDFNVSVGSTPLLGVTDAGELVSINASTIDRGALTVINDGTGEVFAGVEFGGAALGPQNLYGAAYSNYVFATTTDGMLIAFDSSGTLQGVFGTAVADDGTGGGNESVDASITSHGIAFSPLDFNLWHTTQRQGTTAGHGINAAPDNSRVPSEIDLTLDKENSDNDFSQQDGAVSFYFGLEQFHQPGTSTQNTYLTYTPGADNSQYGIYNNDMLRDLTNNSTIGNNVNLPGGALGSLTTNSFSLEGYASKDAPTLYFSYFLETEDTDSAVNVEMRDSARAFISLDNGVTWILVATNNSTKSTSANDWELPTYITHTASENTNGADTGRDFVQELFDNTGVWRQARIDLSNFAGESDIMLRFDYSTAGTIGTLNGFESDVRGDTTNSFNSNRRGQNNTGEGFYIDDIIVGFAERGEMITNSNTSVSSFFNVYGTGNNEPGDAADQILTGSYNLEIRRATEYAVLISPTDPFIAVATLFDTNDRLVEEDGLLGDDNFRREQGMVLIEGNQIQSSHNGIVVETVRGDVFEGWFPHQGGTRALPNLNTQQLAPGAVLQNNLIVNSTFSGIDITGDIISPESVIPVVKVVNNTIYGGLRGINVFSRVSPTIVNNIIANTVSGITVDSVFATAVVDANLFQDNLVNGTMGTNWIDLLDTEALFVDAAAGNFYLADNSKAIDSSLNRLADRPLFTAVKTPLGIPASDVFAPSYDTYGQLRVDDPTQSPPPGLGSNVFKDRGALERADFVGPTATITLPPDNDVNGLDLDPVATQVYVANPALFTSMIVELRDTGIGIDDAQISSSQFTLTAQTSTGTTLLEEGTHYLFSYNSNTNEAIFSAVAGVFELDTRYTITVDNSAATGITDRAGNLLQPNQTDLSTSFSIVVTDGVNDPPVNNFNTTLIPDSPNTAVSTESETPLIFSTVNGNALTVADPDAFLGDGQVEVTLTAVNGTLTLGSTANVLITTGTGLGNETTFTFQGLIADVNAALEGTIWTPDSGYYSSLSGATPATLTMTTSDLTNFDGPAETDMDVIDITVNDPPTVQFNSATYSVTETDQGTTTTLNVTLTRDKIGAESTVLISDSGTGTATPGDDYNAIIADTPITFAANQTTATFTITIIGDDIVEFNETIDLAITGITFNALIDPLGQNTAEVTINDNDQAILNINRVTQLEDEDAGDGVGVYRFTASLDNLVDAAVSVEILTQDGTAVSGGSGVGDNDYNSTIYEDSNFNTAITADTITIGALTSSIDFFVEVNTDSVVELNEYFNILMANLAASGLAVTTGTDGIGDILNDDQAILSITGNDVSETDSGSTTTMTFTLTLDNQVAGAIEVDYATEDLEATVADNDYNAVSDSIIFAAGSGSTTETFTVTINGDDKVERDELLTAILSNLQNNLYDVVLAGGGLTTQATGTILNDEQASFIISDRNVNEEAGSITFTVEMDHEVDTAVSIEVNTADGTALSDTISGFVSDNDYTPVTGHQLLFNAGERFKTFTVQINNDNVVELDEEFTVELDELSLSAGGRDVIGTGTATGRILNTDAAQVNISQVSQTEEANGSLFQFTAILTAPVDTTITLDANAEILSALELAAFPGLDAALADIDFQTTSSPYAITFNKEEQTFQFDVEVVNDSIVELNEVFKVAMDNLANDSRNVSTGTEGIGIIQNGTDKGVISIDSSSINEGTPAINTPPGYTSLTFNINLSAAISKDISFAVSTADGTNLPGSTIGNATVADGDYVPVSVPQIFTFAGTPTSGTIPTSQTFTVLIAEDHKVERDEIFKVLLSQLNKAGLNVSLSPTNATGTIVNDDSATITINNVTQLESNGNFTFTATLSNPVDTDISVEIYTEAVSSLLDENDYTAIAVDEPLILNFDTNGPLTKNFTIHVNNDNIVEADEVFSVLFGDLLHMDRQVSSSGFGSGTIINDDSATFSITPVIGTENDSPFQFLVELSNPVDVAITVDAATFNGTAIAPDDYLSFGQTLTFDPSVTQQTVNITVLPDLHVESPETFDLTLSNLVVLDPNDRSVFLTSIDARSSSATTDAAIAVDVVGNYAYVADRDGGLQIFNISNPSSPVHVGTYDFNQQGIAQAIDVVGNLAYLAVGEAGLQIINISNPANPTFVGSIATPARARGVQVVGNLAYVADDSGNGGGLQIIDVSNPGTPTILGSFGVSTPGGLAGGVEVIGNIAYVTDGNNGLHIVNVSDSANPTLIKSVATPGGAAIGLDIVGNFAYVANREGGVQIIDISDPFTASRVGELLTPGIATGVKVVGNFAYVADGTVGLHVIDLSTGDIANTFNTPGSARSLFVSGTLAFVADTFSGLQILEFFPTTTATGTILDPAGPPLTGTASPNTTISTSLVTAPTATDANGETTSVPDSVDWIDEWDSFWVEVWGNTSDGSGISGGNFDLEYNTDYFTATAVEFGSAFAGSSTASIDDQTGIVSGISGQNGHGTLGGSGQVLLARVKFESIGEDNVAIDKVTGFLGPHNLGIRVVNASLDVTDFGGVTASTGDVLDTDLWAVPFDLNDDGTINYRDLITFTSYYGTSVIGAESGLAWSLDFDKSGQINYRDLISLVSNYNRSRDNGQHISFPANFPQEWYGSAITTEGNDSLSTLINAATEEWKTATGNPDLTVQVVVTDLGGQQLGEGHILELDENGIPVKGRVYIDDDAAGLGWYSSVEGLAFDSNGQAIAGSAAEGHYDLYTVLLHEIGHAAGFTTSYSAYTNHVETSDSGQVQFVSWDFIAPLTEDGLHIDDSFYPDDIMGATLDPSTRKMISTLDIQVLQAAYNSADGAVFTPLNAPLMASILQTVSTTETAPAVAPVASVSKPVVAPEQQQVKTATSQSSELQSDTLPSWYLAPALPLSNSSMIVEQSVDQDLLVGSLFDVSYETELSDDLEPEESTLELSFNPEFDLDQVGDSEVADEELDSLFADWSGPLV